MGCGGGKVKIDALDFGNARSAEWIERKLVTDMGSEHSHDFVITTVSGWCKQATATYPVLGDAYNQMVDEVAANIEDATAVCNARVDFYQTAATETDSFFRKGLSAVHMQLLDPNESPEEPPFEGTYEVVGYDQVERYALAQVVHLDSNPYQLFVDNADCEGSPVTMESDGLAAMEDVRQFWTLTEGLVEVDLGSDSYKLHLDGTLAEGDTADSPSAGGIVTKATYDRCEVTWDGSFPEFW